MTKITTLSAIKQCPIFSTLDDAMLQKIASIARMREFAARETIFNEGEDCTGFYLVADGLVKIFKISPDGKEHVLHLMGPGDIFAEAAVFMGKSFPAYADAVKPSELVHFPKIALLELLKTEPEVSIRLLAGLSLLLHKMVSQVEILALKDASARLAQYLKDRQIQGEVRLSAPKSVVASHLGMTPETLSRLFFKLEGLEIIAVDGRTIVVHDLEALTSIAAGESAL